MARFFIVLLFTFLIAGCQSNKGLVSNIPSPNFNGPMIAPSAPSRIVQAQPLAPLPQPTKSALAFDKAWIPAAPARPWKWIVIHHSATPAGGAARFDKEHREERGWDELGYHFVIGNGTDTRDGLIEVGPRWPKQKWGAHAKTPDNRFNDFGIGICLVGNFDIERPTPRQLESLAKLVAYLQATYHVPTQRIIGHGSVHSIDSGGTKTECPGRNLNIALVKRMATQTLIAAGQTVEDEPQTASADTELLGDFPPAPTRFK